MEYRDPVVRNEHRERAISSRRLCMLLDYTEHSCIDTYIAAAATATARLERLLSQCSIKFEWDWNTVPTNVTRVTWPVTVARAYNFIKAP